MQNLIQLHTYTKFFTLPHFITSTLNNFIIKQVILFDFYVKFEKKA